MFKLLAHNYVGNKEHPNMHGNETLQYEKMILNSIIT